MRLVCTFLCSFDNGWNIRKGFANKQNYFFNLILNYVIFLTDDYIDYDDLWLIMMIHYFLHKLILFILSGTCLF